MPENNTFEAERRTFAMGEPVILRGHRCTYIGIITGQLLNGNYEVRVTQTRVLKVPPEDLTHALAEDCKSPEEPEREVYDKLEEKDMVVIKGGDQWNPAGGTVLYACGDDLYAIKTASGDTLIVHRKHLIKYAESMPNKVKTIPVVLDTQKGGDHYTKMGMYQPWQVAHAQMTPEELKGAMKLTVNAYLAREADKGGRLDIEKALHTIQIYLELTNADTKGD